MGDFVYTTVPGKIGAVLQKIRDSGVPDQAGSKWLKSLGFTSSNDSSLMSVLKFIGFVDGQGTPSQYWRDYRGAHYKKVLANAIRNGYQELFQVYPDAQNRDAGDIAHVVSTRSSAGKQVINKTVSTFFELVKQADFADSREMEDENELRETESEETLPSIGNVAEYKVPSVHIDIQIHISPEASAEQIDQVFKSMATHLYGK